MVLEHRAGANQTHFRLCLLPISLNLDVGADSIPLDLHVRADSWACAGSLSGGSREIVAIRYRNITGCYFQMLPNLDWNPGLSERFLF